MVSIVLAGGGTAGHTSPLVATAERIAELDPEARLTCVGTARGLESRVIPAAGHWVAYEAPDAFNAALANLLGEDAR